METAREDSASFHTQARGVLGSLVGTQAQVIRQVFRIVKRMLFIVPPVAVRAGATASDTSGAERDSCTNHRFGRGESGYE